MSRISDSRLTEDRSLLLPTKMGFPGSTYSTPRLAKKRHSRNFRWVSSPTFNGTVTQLMLRSTSERREPQMTFTQLTPQPARLSTGTREQLVGLILRSYQNHSALAGR